MNRWIILSMASVMAAFGTYASSPLADPPVNLQASTPGTAQNGHINVNGKVMARNFYATTQTGVAVSGFMNGSTGVGVGGEFYATPNNGIGVKGSAQSHTGFTYGGYFVSDSDNGKAVYGYATSDTGNTYGVHGRAFSFTGRGVFGETTAPTGISFGLYGRSMSSSGRGVFGETPSTSGTTYGGFFQSASPAGYGVLAKNAAGGVGLRAEGNGTALQVVGSSTLNGAMTLNGPMTLNGSSSFAGSASFSGPTQLSGATTVVGTTVFQQSAAFQGSPPFAVTNPNLVANLNADKLDGLDATDFLQSIPVPLILIGNEQNEVLQVQNLSQGSNGITSFASEIGGVGVNAVGATGLKGSGALGVVGETGGGVGVYGHALSSVATTYGVQGQTVSPSGFGVYSLGNMGASGTKPFRIDHPFDPTNKYLFHYSSESPLPQNFYNGNVKTDANGQAWVTLPDYFESINKDFKYTLTVVDDTDSPNFVQVKVAKEIKDGKFKIRTSAPNVKVSWEVKALRNDKWVQKYPPKTEVEKEGSEKGSYQHPELYGMPEEMGINYARTHKGNGAAKPTKR